MNLIDKLRAAATLPPETDMPTVLGRKTGERFVIDKDGLTLGNETVSLADVRLALAGGPIPTTPEPRRAVAIGDL